MGCKGSKLDNQEAVALCHGRADLIAAAGRHRYALADAHAALADSFESLAAPLHLLLQASPQLTLPSGHKGGGLPSSASAWSPPDCHYSSHIHFGSSSGSESASPAGSLPAASVASVFLDGGDDDDWNKGAFKAVYVEE